MAKKPTKKGESSIITRITAADATLKAILKKPAAKATPASTEPKEPKLNPWQAIAKYFSGSWYEIRQVRWPDRRSTWGMTGALVLFTAFFVIIVVLLDFGLSKLFNLIIGK
ncbi:MAG: preprotein translocase subunit SecE [Candidatus Saccharimonas sp.]